jgi:adenylate kinase
MIRVGYVAVALAGVAVIAGCSLFKKNESQQSAPVAPKTIFSFLGAPGSGKGTLAEQCVKQLGFKVLSTGNLCREAIASGSEQGKQLETYTKSGQLVPDDLITSMVDTWLTKETTSDTAIILDGYPRTAKQAEQVLNLLKQKYADHAFRVISLDIPDQEIIDRIATRLMCENKKCQAVYNSKLMKDPNNLVCEKCGGKLIRRVDDKEEVVRERLQVFAKNNNEVVNFYKNAGIAIESLSASKQTPAEIFENFKKMICTK